MNIRYWSDFSCPFCYIGETRLHRAIWRLGIGERLHLERMAFELSPNLKGNEGKDALTLFAEKYSMAREKAEKEMFLITKEAKSSGLDIHLDKAIFCNTRDAHRLQKYALSISEETADKVGEILFEAFF